MSVTVNALKIRINYRIV